MNPKFFLLIITLKEIYSYNPKRHIAQTSLTGNLKNMKSKADPVIPARYKITSTTNYEDPTIRQNFPAEYFPEVEYPESIVDSSKPFYISTSPFSNDVKTTFNSLAAKANNKAKTASDYSWTEKSKEKLPVTSKKGDVNEIATTIGNKINSGDNSTNETLCEDITRLEVNDDASIDEVPYSDNNTDKLFTNLTTMEQSAECEHKDYVEFIHKLDEVMKNLTNADTPKCNEDVDNTAHIFESECSNELKLSSEMITNNNASIMELNGNSFLEEQHPERIRNPLFDDLDTNDAVSSLTSLLNEYITNVTAI